jgi:hypothetical protein
VEVGVGKVQKPQRSGPRGREQQFVVIGGRLSQKQVAKPLFGADGCDASTGEKSRGTGGDTFEKFTALHGMAPR